MRLLRGCLLVLVVSGCGGPDRSAEARRACVEAARDKAGAEADIKATRVDRKEQTYSVQGEVRRAGSEEGFFCVAGPPKGDDQAEVTVTTVLIGKRQTPVGAG